LQIALCNDLYRIQGLETKDARENEVPFLSDEPRSQPFMPVRFQQSELRELERDGTLSKRQHLTIRLMFKCYGKKPVVYVLLALTFGWLGVHRIYAERDIMSGFMLPVSLFYVAFMPVFFFSGREDALQVGIWCFVALVLIAWAEIPFHVLSIRRENLDLKHYLQKHVKF
jgi:hypothetical protein